MNKFELNKTMESFGLKNADYYEIGSQKFYHGGSYYTIVEGKTPYELALSIYKKYDNDIFKIRVNGSNESEVPSSDIYTYHIDTIEGLVVFLLETQDYYSEKQECSEKIDEILDSIYTSILNDVSPKTSIYDWMLDRENKKDYFKTLLAIDSTLDFQIRKKIESFDSALNPFCNDNVEINNYGFIVKGYTKENYNWFSLYDNESDVTMTTIREKNGFVIKLHIVTDDPYEINVYHYYDEKGEEFAFERYDKTGLSRLEYNLTNNTFGEHYGKKHTITKEDKEKIIQILDEYTALANRIVKKNIEHNLTNKKMMKKTNGYNNGIKK